MPTSQVNSPFLRVSIIGLLLEVATSGALVVLFVRRLWKILSIAWVYGQSRRDAVLLAASTVMFAAAITHVGIDFHIMIVEGILKGSDFQALSNTMHTFYAPNKLGFTWFLIYVIQTLLSDGFMVYRAFVVWNSSWLIILFPVVLMIAANTIGVTIISLDFFPMHAAKGNTLSQVYFVTTSVTNVILTSLVMLPLLSRRGVHEHRPKGSQIRTVKWRVIESILQSAAIFTVSSLSFTICRFVSPLGTAFCHYFFPPVVALVFVMTVARICLPPGSSERNPRRPDAGLDFSIAYPHLHQYSYPYHYSRGPYGEGAPSTHSQSCPSLPIVDIKSPDSGREQDLEGNSYFSHAGMVTSPLSEGCSPGGTRPIAIKVEVSTMRTSDGAVLCDLIDPNFEMVTGVEDAPSPSSSRTISFSGGAEKIPLTRTESLASRLEMGQHIDGEDRAEGL